MIKSYPNRARSRTAPLSLTLLCLRSGRRDRRGVLLIRLPHLFVQETRQVFVIHFAYGDFNSLTINIRVELQEIRFLFFARIFAILNHLSKSSV